MAERPECERGKHLDDRGGQFCEHCGADLMSESVETRAATREADLIARLQIAVKALKDLEENVTAINNDISNNPDWKTSRNDISEALSGVCVDARDALRRIGEKQGEVK